jgi:hypothetical protein
MEGQSGKLDLPTLTEDDASRTLDRAQIDIYYKDEAFGSCDKGSKQDV